MTAWRIWLHRHFPRLFIAHDYELVERVDSLWGYWCSVPHCRACGHWDESKAEFVRPVTR